MNRIKRILGFTVAPTKLSLSWIPCLALIAIALPLGPFAQTKEKTKKSDGPDIEIYSQEDSGRDMHQMFQHILDDPEATIQMDGKKYKVKDLTPAQRAELRRKLDRTETEVRKATAEAMRAAHEAMKDVFAANGPFEKSMEQVRNIKITMPDMEAINKEIAEGMKESQAERDEALREARKDVEEAKAEAQKEMAESEKAMADSKKEMGDSDKEAAEAREEMRQAEKEAREHADVNLHVDVDAILKSVMQSLKSLDLPPAPGAPGHPHEMPAMPEFPAMPPMPPMSFTEGHKMTPAQRKAFEAKMKVFEQKMRVFEEKMKVWGEKFGKTFEFNFDSNLPKPGESPEVPEPPSQASIPAPAGPFVELFKFRIAPTTAPVAAPAAVAKPAPVAPPTPAPTSKPVEKAAPISLGTWITYPLSRWSPL